MNKGERKYNFQVQSRVTTSFKIKEMELRIFGMPQFEMEQHLSCYANILKVAIFFNHKGGITNRRRCLRK